MHRFIFVKTSFEGMHQYLDAPSSVSFLRSMHRHLFGVCLMLEVFHDDRELEFFIVKRELDNYIANCLATANLSCETFAVRILEHARALYGKNRVCRVSVDEDGENGAVVFDKAEKIEGSLLDDKVDFL